MIVEVGRATDRVKVEIIPFQPDMMEAVLELYRSTFGEHATNQFRCRWEWQFRDNPYCELRASDIQVAVYQGRVVGHMGAYPLPLRYFDHVRPAMCGTDLMVNPRFKGLGTCLIKLYAAQTPGVGCGVHPAVQSIVSQFGGRPWAVSRTRFYYRLRDRAAWCRVLRNKLPSIFAGLVSPTWTGLIPFGVFERCRHEPNPLQKLKRRRAPRANGVIDLKLIDRFEADYDDLWKRFSSRVRFTIEKTSAYMNWRYVECPTVTPFRWAVREDGQLVAVVVGLEHPIFDRRMRNSGFEGEIMELIVDGISDRGLDRLLAEIISYFDSHRVDSVNITGLHLSLYDALKRVGFERCASDRFANILIFNDDDWAFVQGFHDKDWYLTSGDGDALN